MAKREKHESNADATLLERPLAAADGQDDDALVAARKEAVGKQLTTLRGALTEYFRQLWEAQRDEQDESPDGAADVRLGDALGLSDSLVSQLRRGAKQITVEHLAMLAVYQSIPVLVVLARVVAVMAELTSVQVGVTVHPDGSSVDASIARQMKPSASPLKALPPPKPKPR
jgi:hypothetical protein